MLADFLHYGAALPVRLQLRDRWQEGLRWHCDLSNEVVMDQKTFQCRCGTAEQLLADPQCPIEHDEELHEYNLVSRDSKVRYRMYYCIFCGGKLPESKRGGLFTEPSKKEIKEVQKLLSKITSTQQAIGVLGQPDETVKAPKPSARENGGAIQYKRHHRYWSRWQTLDLTIREREDGSFDSAFTGKSKRA